MAEQNTAHLLATALNTLEPAAVIETHAQSLLEQIDAITLCLQSDWDPAELLDQLVALSIAADELDFLVLAEIAQQLIGYASEDEDTLPRQIITDNLSIFLLEALNAPADQLDHFTELLLATFSPFDENDDTDLASLDDAELQISDCELTAQSQSAPIFTVGRDMLDILNEELLTLAPQLAEYLPALIAQDSQAGAEYAELIERLASACDGIGMQPISHYLMALNAQIVNGTALTTELNELTLRLASYCEQPTNEIAVDALLSLLLPETRADLRAPLLAQQVVLQTQEALIDRIKQATASDISLAVPSDIHPELMEGLLQELPIQTSAFAQAIQKIVSGQGSLQDLDIAKRAAHTLKGAANTVGIAGVANLTHHLEDILIALSDAKQLPQAQLARLLSEAGDCLEGMTEALLGLGAEPQDSLAVFQAVLNAANQIDNEGISPQTLLDNAHSPIPQENTLSPASTEAASTEAAPVETASEAMIRIPARLIDDMLALLGESIISVAQMRELLQKSKESNTRLRVQNQNIQQLVNDLENRVEIRSLGLSASANNADFDSLEFESYNELHSISRRLSEFATDAREQSLDSERLLVRLGDAIEGQHRLQVSNQEIVMRTRMVPVSTIEARLQRAVRQTARLLDKDVELQLIGNTTLVDNYLLNTIVDPLMHVLRNAIDHGIELPEARQAAKKRPQGRIDLAFTREGNSIVVRCKDDGAGLNLVAIHRRAQVLGLIPADSTLTQSETARLILRHGFSTREASNQVSGRGIGMDVVLATVNALKGSLILHPEQTGGLLIEMRFPVSLVASHVLLIEADQQKLAISTGGILDLTYCDHHQMTESNGESWMQMGEQTLPLVSIESIFGLPEPVISNKNKGLPIVILQLDSGALKAVCVRHVIDSRDIVVKDLGQFVPYRAGMIGATVLGDGTIAPVIDLRELIDSERQTHFMPSRPQEIQQQLPRALIVDDSLSARRAAAQLMRDSGFEVRTAIDGLDAIEQVENWLPDVLLVDMEMPRMNGLELTAYFRSQTELKTLPIIMITSRSTGKHRRQAELAGVSRYLVKPFNDDLLMKNIDELLELSV